MTFGKSIHTKQHLLETAARTIARVGLEKMTSRLLAKQAGVSLGCVTRYFPKFSKLFPEVMTYLFEQNLPTIRERPAGMSAEDVFYRIVQQNFNYFAIENPHYQRCILLSYFYIGINSEVRETHLKILNDSVVAMDKLLQQISSENYIVIPENDRKLLARSFLEQLISSVGSCSFTSDKLKKQKIAEDTLSLIKLRMEHLKCYSKASEDLNKT